MATFTVDVYQYFPITDRAGTGRDYATAVDFLNYVQVASGHVLHAHVTQTLAFLETPYLSGDQARTVTQTLRFFDDAERVRVGYVYQNFTVNQAAGIGREGDDAQLLVFTDSATIERVHSGDQTLTFVETVTLGAVRGRSAGDTLAFSEGATIYSPSAEFIAVPVSAIDPSPTVTLSGKGGSITLPAPDFGNVETLGQTRIQRNTRGGTFVIFRDPMWPTTDEFDVTFSYLCATQAEGLRALVAKNVGLACTYLDHEGQSWSVLVTNPDLEVTQPGRSNEVVSLKMLVAH